MDEREQSTGNQPETPKPPYTIGTVLKTDVTTFDHFRLDMPASGNHLTIWHALNTTYLGQGRVFEGLVDEWITMASRVVMSSEEARRSFEDLQRFGMLRIGEDGVFSPTGQYLEYFDGQLVTLTPTA